MALSAGKPNPHRFGGDIGTAGATPMRTLLGTVLLSLCLATGAMAAPNIVVILTDDQEDTGSMAYLPNLQALAAQGVTFKNSFVNFSLCSPSRSSFFTGEAAHNDGIKSATDYSTDVLKDRAVRFIKDQAGSAAPFFMLIATKAPHGQGEEGQKERRYRRLPMPMLSPIPSSPKRPPTMRRMSATSRRSWRDRRA